MVPKTWLGKWVAQLAPRAFLLCVVTVAGCRSESILPTDLLDKNALATTGALIRGQAPEAPSKREDPEQASEPGAEVVEEKVDEDPGAARTAREFQASTGAVAEQVIGLDDALRLAGVDNPTIGLAEEVVRANLAQQMLARALLFPTLNVGATLSLHQGTLLSVQGIVRDVRRESLFFGAGADVRGASTEAIPGVVLTSHLGDACFAPRVAQQKTLSSSFDAVATRHQVLLQVSNAYLSLSGAEANLLVLRAVDAEFAELVTLTANFAAKGIGREGDAQRAASDRLLLQGSILQEEESASFWAAELSRLLSTDPAIRLRPGETGPPPLLHVVDPETPLESLLEQALARRPEIAARSLDVARNETRLRQEQVRPLVPTVAVGFSAGDFGGGSDQAGYRFSHFNSRTDFDVVAFWTVQNLGFGNWAIQKRVRAEIREAEAERLRVIDAVRREVSEALARVNAFRLQIDNAQKRVETAQAAFNQDLTRARNLQGRVIEVLDSLHLASSARTDLVRAIVGFSQAQLQLYVALGNTPATAKR